MAISFGTNAVVVMRVHCSELTLVLPGSVALLDGHPTGDQEVAGSTPARSAIFRGDWL